jgi:endogenous inhibitor of DNA gyrase (YacG/DUF329 family)
VTAPRTVPCPQCGIAVVWGPQSPHRPFCSARCRQIDLGAWASESYCVPGHASPEDFSDPALTPSKPRE